MQKIKIVETNIEYDNVNKLPTLVYTDEHGTEWVQENQVLIKKNESWYWKKD